MNRKPKMQKFPLKAFQAKFPDDAACLEWLKSRLYPNGIECKNCKRVTKHHRVASRPSYCCDNCGNHVHPTAGTIFHKSPTPLTTWFYAIYLMSATRCGISAKQIERETGVTYKTAWRMFKQIRTMLADENAGPIGGKNSKGVEVDESYFGGTRRVGRGNYRKHKTMVVGMVERKGEVRALTAERAAGPVLLPMIKEHVLPKSVVFTDELVGYEGIPNITDRGYVHRRINHSEKVYVVGDVHTNTIEGFWSLVKNGLRGVYHSVGKSYLQSYLNEYSFRYNRRFDTQPMFLSFLHQISKSEEQIKSEQGKQSVEIPF
jgi:transposase